MHKWLYMLFVVVCIPCVLAESSIQTSVEIENSPPNIIGIHTYTLYDSPTENVAKDAFILCTNEERLLVYAELNISDNNGVEEELNNGYVNISAQLFTNNQVVELSSTSGPQYWPQDHYRSIVVYTFSIPHDELVGQSSISLQAVAHDGYLASNTLVHNISISLKLCERQFMRTTTFSAWELQHFSIDDILNITFMPNSSVTGSFSYAVSPTSWSSGIKENVYSHYALIEMTPSLEKELFVKQITLQYYEWFASKKMVGWLKHEDVWEQFAVSKQHNISSVHMWPTYFGELVLGKEDKSSSSIKKSSCVEETLCGPWSDCDKIISRVCITYSCSEPMSTTTEVKKCGTSDDPISLDAEEKKLNPKTTKKALFDIYIELLNNPVQERDNLNAKIGLINFDTTGSIFVNISYTISDKDGVLVFSEQETREVLSQLEFIRNFNTSILNAGDYSLHAVLQYAGQEEPAEANEDFNIVASQNRSFLPYGVSAIFVLLLFALRKWLTKFFRKSFTQPKELQQSYQGRKDI